MSCKKSRGPDAKKASETITQRTVTSMVSVPSAFAVMSGSARNAYTLYGSFGLRQHTPKPWPLTCAVLQPLCQSIISHAQPGPGTLLRRVLTVLTSIAKQALNLASICFPDCALARRLHHAAMVSPRTPWLTTLISATPCVSEAQQQFCMVLYRFLVFYLLLS